MVYKGIGHFFSAHGKRLWRGATRTAPTKSNASNAILCGDRTVMAHTLDCSWERETISLSGVEASQKFDTTRFLIRTPFQGTAEMSFLFSINETSDLQSNIRFMQHLKFTILQAYSNAMSLVSHFQILLPPRCFLFWIVSHFAVPATLIPYCHSTTLFSLLGFLFSGSIFTDNHCMISFIGFQGELFQWLKVFRL